MQLPSSLHNYSMGANFPHQDQRKGKYVLRPVHPITSSQPNGVNYNQSLAAATQSGPGVAGWSPLPYSPQEDPNRVPFSQVFSSAPHRSSQQPSQVRSIPQQETIRPKQSTLNANAPEFVYSTGKSSPNLLIPARPKLLNYTRRGWRSPENELSPRCPPRIMNSFVPKSHSHVPRNPATVFNTHLAPLPRDSRSFGGICSTNLRSNSNMWPPRDSTVESVSLRSRTGPKSPSPSNSPYNNNNVQSSVNSTGDEPIIIPEPINPNSNSRRGGPKKPRGVRSKESHNEGNHSLQNKKKLDRDTNQSKREGGVQGGRRNPPGNNKKSRMKPWVLKRRSNDRFISSHHGATIIRQYSGKLSNLVLHNQMEIIVLQKCAATIGVLPQTVHTLVLQECNVDIKKMKASVRTMIVEDCSPKLDYLPCSLRNLVLLRSSSALDFLPQSIKNLVICDSTVNLDRLPDSLREIALRNIFADHKLLPSKAVILKLWGEGKQNLSDQAMVQILSRIVTWVPSELLMVVADYAVEKVEYLHNIAELARGDKRIAFAEYQLMERQVLDARRRYYE